MKAKQLLKTMNMEFTEEKLDVDFTREILLEKFPSAKSYPVIVVDGFYIGGYSQLSEMIASHSDNRKLLNEGV
jgi:glutaredoxin